MARDEGRAGAARRPGFRGELRRRRRGRARRGPAAGGQRLQGPARAPCRRLHAARPRQGGAMSVKTRAIGVALDRLDGPLKVRGAATYADEWPLDDPAYVFPLQATIAAGRITGVDTAAATATAGVLAVLTHENAPKNPSFCDPEVTVMQSGDIAFRGQFVGAVVAETSELARDAASLVRFGYEERPHDVELRADR